MVSGYCKTNLDEHKGRRWPVCFAALPRKGDLVRSGCGCVLAVVSVTHEQRDGQPRIAVELHRG